MSKDDMPPQVAGTGWFLLGLVCVAIGGVTAFTLFGPIAFWLIAAVLFGVGIYRAALPR